MNHGLGTLFFRLRRNHDTASWLIYLQNDICLRIDNPRVLTRSTNDENHIRTSLTNFVNRRCRTRNRLTPDNRFHCWIGSHCHSIGDNRLRLCGKVIRISRSNDHVAILLFHLVCLCNLLITLRSCTSDDTNLEISCRLCRLSRFCSITLCSRRRLCLCCRSRRRLWCCCRRSRLCSTASGHGKHHRRC